MPPLHIFSEGTVLEHTILSLFKRGAFPTERTNKILLTIKGWSCYQMMHVSIHPLRCAKLCITHAGDFDFQRSEGREPGPIICCVKLHREGCYGLA